MAGLPDVNPHVGIPNLVVQTIKGWFQGRVVSYRQEVADYCRAHDMQLEFYNGSGSGNYVQVLKVVLSI